jgi:hypothetical protein
MCLFIIGSCLGLKSTLDERDVIAPPARQGSVRRPPDRQKTIAAGTLVANLPRSQIRLHGVGSSLTVLNRTGQPRGCMSAAVLHGTGSKGDYIAAVVFGQIRQGGRKKLAYPS